MDKDYSTIILSSSFNTKLAGSSFRQDNIKKLIPGQRLQLVREPKNQYDPNALAVFNESDQVGYINKELAAKLSPAIDSKAVDYTCTVTNITGGTADKPTLGVNILLQNKDDWDLVKSPLGGVARFNKAKHVYTTIDGKPMLSGSKFQEMYTEPFPDLGEKYDKKAQQARDFGTAIHEAIELRGKYGGVASSELVRPIINALFDQLSLTNKCGFEVFITDGRLCGFIDMLEVVDDKTVNIWDWKIVNDLEAKGAKMLAPYQNLKTKLEQYALQQNFYRYIIESRGYKVNAMRLANPVRQDDKIEWKVYQLPVIDIRKEVDKCLSK